MNIYRFHVSSISTGNTIAFYSTPYDGQVGLLKGDGTAKDQLKAQTKLQQQAFDLQKQRQALVDSSLKQYLEGNGEGFSPEQIALLKSAFLNQMSQRFNGAGSNVRQALLARGSGGGDAPVGGDYTRGISTLEGLKGVSTATGLRDIDLASFEQALKNKFAAAGVIQGNAQINAGNVSTFGSGASNALNQYVQAANQGFGNAFSTTFGAGLGKVVASGVGGAIKAATGMGG